MDLLTSAALLGFLAWGATFLLLALVASATRAGSIDDVPAWVKVVASAVMATVVVVVVAHSTYGAQNEVMGVKLSDANTWDVIVAAFIVWIAEAAVFLGAEKVLPNIGIPMPTPAQKKALDAGAERYAAGQLLAGGGSHPEGEEPAAIDSRVGELLDGLRSTDTPPAG